MKHEKSRTQEGAIDVVSVCGALDVCAVASGEQVTVYRMQLSKVVVTNVGAPVLGMCWGPNGRILCCGTQRGLRLVNIEDGTIVGDLWEEEVTSVSWVSSTCGTASVKDASVYPSCPERAFSSIESTFQPPLTPFHLTNTDPEYEALRLRHNVLESASAAYGKDNLHFVIASVRDSEGHSIRVVPFGVTEMLRVTVPCRPLLLTAIGGTKSIAGVATGEGEGPHIVGFDLKTHQTLQQMSKAALYLAMLSEASSALTATAKELQSRAAAAEKDFVRVLDALPSPVTLFVKGPTSQEHKAFLAADGDMKSLHKSASPLHSALTDIANIASLQIMGSCEYLSGVMEYFRHDLSQPGPDVSLLVEQARQLRVKCRAVLEAASASQVSTAQLFGWLSEMSLYTARRRDGMTGHHTDQGEEPTYDKSHVVALLERGGSPGQHVSHCSRALAEFHTHLTVFQATLTRVADSVRCASSRGILRSVHPISSLPGDATGPLEEARTLVSASYAVTSVSLSKPCLRLFAAAGREAQSVNLLVLKDKGDKCDSRWVMKSATFPCGKCFNLAFYVDAAESDVRLLALCVVDDQVCLTSHALISDGAFVEGVLEGQLAEPASVPVEVPDTQVVQSRLSCSPKGLACLSVTTAQGHTVLAEFLMDDDDEEEGEDDEGDE